MRLFWIVIIGFAAGCGSEAGTPAGSAAAAASAGWDARSTTGVAVRVEPTPAAPRVGPLHLRIAVAAAEVARDPLTVDLASPTMPMHGITRAVAERVRPGVYTVGVEIPMEGRWALYVNLDAGDDAAVFEFDVPAPAAAHGGGARGAEPHHAGADQTR